MLKREEALKNETMQKTNFKDHLVKILLSKLIRYKKYMIQMNKKVKKDIIIAIQSAEKIRKMILGKQEIYAKLMIVCGKESYEEFGKDAIKVYNTEMQVWNDRGNQE
jgi:hypothetical protein